MPKSSEKNYKNIKLISEDFSNEDIINNIEYFLKNENIEDNVINFDIKYKKIEEVIRESKQWKSQEYIIQLKILFWE